jgi:hypothetical protein
MKPVDMARIGLRPREMSVLQYAAHARANVEGGRYLCGIGQRRSAERLMARGFLTKAEATFFPPQPDWLVVKLTDRNVAALRRAERAAVS